MITFGLTGGIACGKSTVTKTFRKNGIPIVDADLVARDVVVPGSYGLWLIVNAFGKDYLSDDGNLNRTKMADLVFHDSTAMGNLNKIMKPLIEFESTKQINAWVAQGHSIVGYDAALIVEQGNQDKFRPLIVVSCPRDMQVARLMNRNNLTLAQAMARIESQMPVEKKIAVADHVIDTSGSIEESIKQTETIINSWR